MNGGSEHAHAPRIVVLCCDGFFQRHLVKSLHETYHVEGIVVYRPSRSKGALGTRLLRYAKPQRLLRYIVARWDMGRANRAAAPLVRELFGGGGGTAAFPKGIDIEVVEDINEARAVRFVSVRNPDLVCVNGTNLLRGDMLALQGSIPLGIINLPTGLSPYTRGGNCNLYALLEGHPEWVGVTVHHLDSGIDSGDLIITAQVPMVERDNFEMIEARTFRTGIDLTIVAVRQLVEGRAARVRQWQNGRLYLKRTGFVYEPWHRFQVNLRLRNGLLRDYMTDKYARDADVRLVGELH